MLSLNREFKIVFQPKDPSTYNKRRFGVGAGSLAKYVGEQNAKTAIQRALKSTEDKCTVKLRTLGRIDFYVK